MVGDLAGLHQEADYIPVLQSLRLQWQVGYASQAHHINLEKPTRYRNDKCLCCDITFTFFYFIEVSPAAQGASLTEGKRAKRGKKQDGSSSSPKQGSDGSENELDATGNNV